MAKIKLKYSPILVVCWDDAHSSADWMDAAELKPKLKPTIATTFGFVVHENDDYLILADSYFEEDDTVSNYTKIPKKMIKEMKEVELQEPRKKKSNDKDTETATG